MALDIVRRFVNGAWKTEAAETGGGGGLPVGGTTGQVLTKESNADGDAGWENGGSQPPTARGEFTGGGSNDPTIANNGVAWLGWSATNIPNDVLDLTDPFNPTVTASGIYAMRVSVLPYALSVDGYFKVVAVMAVNSDQAESDNDSRLATAAQPTPEGSSGLTWYVAQGDIIGVRVYNRDGSSDQRFGIDVATIQRVT